MFFNSLSKDSEAAWGVAPLEAKYSAFLCAEYITRQT